MFTKMCEVQKSRVEPPGRWPLLKLPARLLKRCDSHFESCDVIRSVFLPFWMGFRLSSRSAMLTATCKIRCFSFHPHMKIPLSNISCPFIPFLLSARRNFHFLLSFILPFHTFSILLPTRLCLSQFDWLAKGVSYDLRIQSVQVWLKFIR